MFHQPQILVTLLSTMVGAGSAHPVVGGTVGPSCIRLGRDPDGQGTANLNARQAAGIDVGPCTDFSMSFKTGFAAAQSPTEVRFGPSDATQFSQGAALNPAIISNAMCDTFVNACAKSAITRDICKTVKATIDAQLASGQLARDQSYADAWLSGLEDAFGIESTGRGTEGGVAGAGEAAGGATGDADAGAGAGADAGGATGGGAVDAGAGDSPGNGNGNADAAAGGAAGCAAPTGAAVEPRPPADAAAGVEGGAGAVANIQTFTGSLNGVAATPVLQSNGARPFSVKGDTFVNAGAALQRSCDQQFNSWYVFSRPRHISLFASSNSSGACMWLTGSANAANSGQGAASVSECEAQNTACQQAVAAIAI